MAKKGKIEEILEEALKILGDNPKGLEYGELHDKIAVSSGQNRNTIARAIGSLIENHPDQVVKPARGLYLLKKHAENADDTPKQTAKAELAETKLYAPFAEHLEKELEECTDTLLTGNFKLGGPWGTPDVLGTNKFTGNALRPQIEIVSAEIKVSTSAREIVKGFGQACAYKVFSHKVYLVIPKEAEDKDRARIESLCIQFGIGLIVFVPDTEYPTKTQWEIRARAIKSEPDYFYADQLLENLSKNDRNKLVG